MDFNRLRDVYRDQLKDIFSAEMQLVSALPIMVQAASASDLKQAFQRHLEQTKDHMETVDGLLSEMNITRGNKQCVAMQGLIEEANETANTSGYDDARDAALIGAVQKIEHYEIATYGSLRTWARLLGENKAADALQKILDEEYSADDTLTELAEGHLNQAATH